MKKIAVLFVFLISSQIHSQNASKSGNIGLKNVYLDVTGGYAQRLAETPGSGNFEKRNFDDLKKGFSYDASLYFRLDEESDSFLGFKYNSFSKKATQYDVYVQAPNGDAGVGEYTNDVKVDYYGLSFLFSDNSLTNESGANFEMGLGYINYRNNAVYLRDYSIKGGTFGVYSSGSYYLKLSDGFYFGPKVGFLYGLVDTVDIKGPLFERENAYLKGDDKIDLMRLDLSLGLRFKF